MQLLREVRIAAPEVDQLGRGIDLRLEHGLRLAEHRRGIQRGPPRRGEQLRSAKKDGGTFVQ